MKVFYKGIHWRRVESGFLLSPGIKKFKSEIRMANEGNHASTEGF